MTVDTNPYAAPDSDLLLKTPGTFNQRFYVVSPLKFLVLYFGTLSLYDIFWVYKHWTQFKRATKGDQWPVMRTLFPVFFIHSLAEEIDHSLRRNNVQHAWHPGLFSAMVVILMIAGRILDRLGAADIGSPFTDILGMLTIFATGYFQYRIQCAANAACGDPEGNTNKNFTAANFAWLAFGCLFWLLSLAGIYILLNPSAFSE